MKKIFLALVLAVFSYAGNLNIAAAANTTYAFDEIKAEFAKLHPDITINVSLGASGGLSTQIRNGAPFDIFLAADMKFADDLHKDGFALAPAVTYAKGKLAMLSIRGFDVSKGLEILKDPGVKTISIGNPKTAPYGTASVAAFEKAGVYEAIKPKLVEAKSIGDALSQTLSAADIGFVAASAMYSPKMSEYKEGEHFVLVDESLYEPIAQGIVVLKHAEANPDAKAFYDFILGEGGKAIFKKYGYSF